MATKDKSIWQAAHEGDLQTVIEHIEKKGKNIDSKDEDERTALHWAASAARLNVVSYLLEKGANPDSTDESKSTPFMSAVAAGHEAVAKVLLDSGKINVNSKNDTGRTPLHYACSKALVSIVELLLAKGAKVNVADNYGVTPLHRAASNSNEKTLQITCRIIEMLLQKGANLDAMDKHKQTPLQIACVENCEKIALMLVAAGADVEIENADSKNAMELCLPGLPLFQVNVTSSRAARESDFFFSAVRKKP